MTANETPPAIQVMVMKDGPSPTPGFGMADGPASKPAVQRMLSIISGR